MRILTNTSVALLALLTLGMGAFAQGKPSRAAGAAHKVRKMLGAKEQLDPKMGRYKKVDLNHGRASKDFEPGGRAVPADPNREDGKVGHLKTVTTQGTFGRRKNTHVLTLPNGHVYTSRGGEHVAVGNRVQRAIRTGQIHEANGPKASMKKPLPVQETLVGGSRVKTETTQNVFGGYSSKHTVTLANGRVLGGKRNSATHEQVVRGLRGVQHYPEVHGNPTGYKAARPSR